MDLADYARDHTTAELLRSKNYKQVLRNLDKRLKKSAGDIQSTALKANVLLLSGDLHGSHTACAHLVALKPPVADTSLLELVYYNLCELKKLGHEVDDSLLDNLWQNAINAQQKQDDKIKLMRRWASRAIRQGQWQQAVKASMLLQKASPANSTDSRGYWFWQIVSRYMAGQSASSDQMKAVHLGLVLRILEKAVKDIPENAESIEQPGLYISNAPEFKLLIDVLSRQNKDSELLQALGKLQKLAQKDYAFGIERSRILSKLSDHSDRWKEARSALDVAEEQHRKWLLDDFRVWSELCEAALLLDSSASNPDSGPSDESIMTLTKNLAQHHANSNPFSRAPQQVLLDLLWHEASTVDSVDGPSGANDRFRIPSRVQICQKHMDKYLDRPFVFDELEDKLGSLSADEVSFFRHRVSEAAKNMTPKPEAEEAAQIKWITAETNALRLDFHYLRLEIQFRKQRPKLELERALQQFITSCIGLYNLSVESTASRARTDSISGDDACLLATKALALLYTEFQTPTALIQRACLLWEMITKSEYNFNARAELTGLLVELGLYPTAFTFYGKLDVKDILHESMSPLVFSRVSTAFPFISKLFDAREELERALLFYEKGLGKIPNYQEVALESRNYAQVMEMEDLARKLRGSPTRWLLGLERRRICRFRRTPYDQLDLSFDAMDLPSNLALNHMSHKTQQYTIFHFGGVADFTLYIKYLANLDLTHELLFNSWQDDHRTQIVLSKLQDDERWEGLLSFDTSHQTKQNVMIYCRQLVCVVSALFSKTTAAADLISHYDKLILLTGELWDENRVSYWSSVFQQESFPWIDLCRECYTIFELLHNSLKVSSLTTTNFDQQRNAAMKKEQQELSKRAKGLVALANERLKSMLGLVMKIQAEVPKLLAKELDYATRKDDPVTACLKKTVHQDAILKFTSSCLRDAKVAFEGMLNLKLRSNA